MDMERGAGSGFCFLLRTMYSFLKTAVFKAEGKSGTETICKLKPLKANSVGRLLQKTLLNTCSAVIAEDMWYILQRRGNSALRSVESP